MLNRMSKFFVNLVQRYLPDAYLFAIVLTFIAYLLALLVTGKGPLELIGMWGDGIWGILTFAMQMILILVTGHSLASSPPIKKILSSVASIPKTGAGAAFLVVLVAGMANFVSWGFGLVVAALLARELGKKVKGSDYPLLVAGGYAGFVVWHGGISGSIPLAVATKGHIVEKLTGIIPMSRTVFSVENLVITWFVILTMPVLFYLIAKSKKQDEIISLDLELVAAEEAKAQLAATTELQLASTGPTFASRLENSIIVNMLFALGGVIYLVRHFAMKGFDLNLNIVIFIFLILGVILHLRPINYVRAVNEAIKGAGGIALQFPLYGGIQGIMVTSGLAAIIANGFVSFSNEITFPLFTFLAGGIINIFVPSGGGQWIVQGPINIPAAIKLGVDPATVAMSIAYGDQWTNMIQPFWALPLLAIAKLNVRDIMGYCVMALIWSGVVFSAGLLIFRLI